MKKYLIILIAFIFVFNLPSYALGSMKKDSESAAKSGSIFSKVKGKFSSSKKNKEESTENQGYYGTIPDINKAFEYKKDNATSSKQENVKNYEDNNDEEDFFKDAPFDDPLFLDKVIKKEKTSNYINDVQKLRFAINNLKKCIEENGDIQRFNACVNNVDIYTKNLQSIYQNQSDSFRESYKYILNVNYKAKTIGNLMYESNYYAQYTPVTTGKYSKENIQKEKNDLLILVNKTLLAIINEE